ncbi:diguanylate cyclase [Pseudodesulfovibrio sp. JC047]|uniref:diguanylate cyclase domain-containing protein n=1 Tax=Pseudodesulfovibrio sp. JC047 TaxID=2683199 RepID=UPI0013D8757E|nr:diguanylate cyclase [Pseudodesulfovibrio sp. JC047]NDV18933.1 diguanylate cyclase [Pseudodesulfovibrio sp. JC047]
MKILLIDDSADFIKKISTLLDGAGHSDLVAAPCLLDAEHALLDATSTKNPIDLILLDLDIAESNGIEAIRFLKGRNEFKDIPLIAITSDVSPINLDRAFAAGAFDYLTKPLGVTELRARVRTALHLRREMLQRMMREQELQCLARKLERMSNQDGLTGLANRRCFDNTLVCEWMRNGREDSPLSLLMIDIDHFKRYNDALGHLRGDECLCSVGHILSRSARRPSDLVARFGGEEFVIVLPNTGSLGAKKVADTIHDTLARRHLDHPNSTVRPWVTVSIGIAASIPTCTNAPEALLQAADTALYSAKKAGRNRTSVIQFSCS